LNVAGGEKKIKELTDIFWKFAAFIVSERNILSGTVTQLPLANADAADATDTVTAAVTTFRLQDAMIKCERLR
jgi:hypothetical protein